MIVRRRVARRFCVLATMLACAAGFVGHAAAAAAPSSVTGYSVRSDGDDRLYRIELTTGAATQLGASGFPKLEGLAINAAGELFAVNPSISSSQSQLLKCSTSTGACAAVGVLGVVTVSSTNAGLTFTPAGQLFLTLNAALYAVNPATGAATFVGTNNVAISGLAATAPTANCASGLFGVGGNGNAGALYCVSTSNGSVSALGNLSVAPTDAGLDADLTTGLLWEITNPADSGAQAEVFSFSPVTLIQSAPVGVTLGGAPIGGFEGLAVVPSVVAAVPPPPPIVPTADDPNKIPTLSEWSLVFLSLLVAIGGWIASRKCLTENVALSRTTRSTS